MGKIGLPKYDVGDIIRTWHSENEYRIIFSTYDAARSHIQYSIIPEHLKITYKTEDIKNITEGEIRMVVWPSHLQRKFSYGSCTCGASSVNHPSHMWYCGAIGGSIF